MTVKRYDREHEDVPLEECESQDGEMVLYEDYAAILQRARLLERALIDIAAECETDWARDLDNVQRITQKALNQAKEKA